MKTATSQRRTRTARRGQGMTEYIIIVALIAIASIGIITLFGDNIRRLFAMAADGLAGNDNVAQANKIGAVNSDNLNKKKMLNFGENNAY
jgi:Flp pilus assembly pilin Flp